MTRKEKACILGLSYILFPTGFKVQASPTEVHSRDRATYVTVEYSLDGASWTICCNMETIGVSQLVRIAYTACCTTELFKVSFGDPIDWIDIPARRRWHEDTFSQFSILDQHATLDTVREFSFGVLKLARYVRLRFDTSSWPQDVQCVRLELVGCQEGQLVRSLSFRVLMWAIGMKENIFI